MGVSVLGDIRHRSRQRAISPAEASANYAAIPRNSTIQPFANPRTGTILRSRAFVSELRMAGHPSLLADAKVGPPSNERTHRQAKDSHHSALWIQCERRWTAKPYA